jgi:hypothetical protein
LIIGNAHAFKLVITIGQYLHSCVLCSLTSADAGRGLGLIDRVTALAIMAALVATHAGVRSITLEGAIAAAGYRAVAISLALMLIAIISAGGEARGFIYFQF